ncbi:hypothetical protein ACQ10P_16075, partial [Enterococcus faecalis]|uniref:hypothetical protein n=1 Tax=Enterococcus faecalis TaxID=1351 RepID=UPI003D6A2ABF
ISPMTDLVFSKADMNQGMMRLQDPLEKRLETAKDQTETDFLEEYFVQLLSSWEQGIATENALYYSDFLYQQKTTLLDYL